jgi:deoxyadenosine/deoxycytidine kinase
MDQPLKRFVAVAGNIGVGKSTLVERLCTHLEWEPFYEPVAENPYLEDFYNNMTSWSFHSQIFFLTRRLLTHRKLLDHPTSAIQDRTVYEDAEIFAYNLYLQGHMTDRDYHSYRELYMVLSQFLPPPDLVVYLDQLNDLYQEWIDNFTLCPVLTVPADDLDFVAHDGHLSLIVSKIHDKLAGKEEVIFEPEEVERANGL